MKFLRLLLALAPLALFAQTPSTSSGQPAAATPAAKLGSTVFKWEDLKVRPTGNGERRDVTDGPTATFVRFEAHVTTLLPGKSSHAPHQHAQEELIILRDGTLDVSLNGVVTRAGPGSLLFFAANDFHNVTNAGDTPATYFVFNFASSLTAAAPKEGATKTAAPGKLVSAVFDWEKLPVKAGARGARRAVVDSPTVTLANFECHVTTVNPGLSPHEPGNEIHHHPDEEIVLMKEGLLEVTLPSGKTTAGPGSIIFAASDDKHGWRNVGSTPATYYVVRIVTDATPKAPARN